MSEETKKSLAEAIKKNNPPPFTIDVTFEKQKGLGGGFRTEWVTGETDTHKFGVDSGAGLGNGFLTFWVEDKKTKERTYYNTKIGDLVEKSLEALKIR